MRKATIILLIVAAVLSMSAIAYSGEILDEGDIVFGPIDLQTVTGDSQLFGCVNDGEYFWVSGGNSDNDPNKLYKFDHEWHLHETYDQPSHSVSGGWQDMAFDGAFLFALYEDQIDEVSQLTGQYTGVSIQCPRSSNTGLTYNPNTDRFWTSSPDGYIYSFNRNGIMVDSLPMPRTISGMDLDMGHPEAIMLWIYSQSGNGMLIEQFNMFTGEFTGVSYDVTNWGGIAGGASINSYYHNPTYQWFEILTLIGQADSDFVVGVEIRSWAPEWRMNCDIQVATNYVPSINGRVLFEIHAINTGIHVISTVVGEIYPTIGSCATGIPYDFNLYKTLGENLIPGQYIVGYYFYDIPDVSGMGLSDAALTFDVGKGIDDYLCSDCDEFRFYNPWGRTGNEVIWGTQWLEWDRGEIPNQTSLGQNYPNPFNATTIIPFDLAERNEVTLAIYNLRGQLVETLHDGYMEAGAHELYWDASAYSSGIYFYKLTTGKVTLSRKMVMVK